MPLLSLSSTCSRSLLQLFVGLRIREEERMLQTELGKEYKDYMNSVPARLLPFLL